jgi:hypothetical protein
VQIQPVPIDLRAFINDTATLFREDANSRNLQLRFRWPKAQVVVLAARRCCATLMDASYGLSSRLGRGSRFWLRLALLKTWGLDARVAARAMVSDEFNSPELLEAENEGYLVLRKPLEASDLRTVLSQWLASS